MRKPHTLGASGGAPVAKLVNAADLESAIRVGFAGSSPAGSTLISYQSDKILPRLTG